MKRYLLLFLMLLLLIGAVQAKTVYVAASDSSASDILQAAHDCTGTNDHTCINTAITNATTGGTVILLAGTYYPAGNINIGSSQIFQGVGDTTVLNFTTAAAIAISNENCNVSFLNYTRSGQLRIEASNTTITNVTSFDCDDSRLSCVTIYPTSETIDGVSLTNVHVIDCDRYGFINEGYGTSVLTNVTYKNCWAVNSGKNDCYDNWCVGYAMSEISTVQYRNIRYDNCYATGSWESGFHMEAAPTTSNYTMDNCTSTDNNWKQKSGFGTGMYASGYIVKTANLTNCVSRDNMRGWYIHTGNVDLHNCTDTNSTYPFFVYYYAPNVNITNSNFTSYFATYGIYLEDSTTTAKIRNTTVLLHNSSSTSYGIYIASTTTGTNVDIRNTTIIDPTEPRTLDYGVYDANAAQVPLRNVCVYGATTPYYNTNIVTACSGLAITGYTYANATSGSPPLSLQFNDTGDCYMCSKWNWSWGDGTWTNISYPSEKNTTHIYSSAGTYDVRFFFSNDMNSSWYNRTSYITVGSATTGTVSSFTMNTTGGYDLVPVQFNDTSTGTPTKWIWQFQNISPGNGSWVTFSDTDVYPGWNYYQKYTIANSPTVDNYPARISIPWATNMNANFSDLRFTDGSGATLAYWSENISLNTTGIFWVNLGLSQSELRVYYGNATALNESTIGIFDFFDHFEGTTLNASKWSEDWTWAGGGNVTVANGNLSVNSTNITSGKGIKSTSTFTAPFTFMTRAMIPKATSSYLGSYISTNTNPTSGTQAAGTFGYGANGNLTGEANGASANWDVVVWNNSILQTFEIKVPSSGYNDFYVNGTLVDNSHSYAYTSSRILRVASYLNTTAVVVDWIAVRDYQETEPTFSLSGTYSNGQQNPAWTFGIGNFSIRLSTSKDGYASNISAQVSFVNVTTSLLLPPPVANFTAISYVGCAPLYVQFNDTSDCYGCEMWNWSFGTGEGWSNTTSIATANATHTYLTAGFYTVSLSVKNVSGTASVTKGGFIWITTVPTVSFLQSATTCTGACSITFTDQSTNSPTAWSWQLQNVTENFTWMPFSAVQNPTFTFGQGNYSIRLSASNGCGASTSTQNAWVNVTVPEPACDSTQNTTASFTCTPSSGYAPLSISCTQDGAYHWCSGVAFNWTWGDGTSNSTTENPSHTYSNVGTYTVTLTVLNATAENSASTSIEVSSYQFIPRPTYTGTFTRLDESTYDALEDALGGSNASSNTTNETTGMGIDVLAIGRAAMEPFQLQLGQFAMLVIFGFIMLSLWVGQDSTWIPTVVGISFGAFLLYYLPTQYWFISVGFIAVTVSVTLWTVLQEPK